MDNDSTKRASSRRYVCCDDFLPPSFALTGWARKCVAALWVCAVLGSFVRASSAQGQSSATKNSDLKFTDEELSEEVNDPTAMLTQVRLLDFYTPGNFETSAQTNAALIQPVIPVARLSFFPVEQIIRPTIRVSMVATGQGSHPITALADTQLYDLFQSQWPHLERWSLRWAIGTTLVFPTASDGRAGENSWQAGPAAALAFAGIPNLWAGFLFQNPISFAYARPGAKPQSTMLFQPGLSYRLGDGWYLKSTDAVWTVDWRHNTPTWIPVSLGFGRVWNFRGQTLDTWTSGEWMAYRQFATITPMYTVRFGMNFVFPEFVLGR
jgi:hypothetical protein